MFIVCVVALFILIAASRYLLAITMSAILIVGVIRKWPQYYAVYKE